MYRKNIIKSNINIKTRDIIELDILFSKQNIINNNIFIKHNITKEKLNFQKCRLDNINDTFIKYIMKSLDKYYTLHKLLKRKYNAQIVTNAWLKCYEIINEFKLLSKDNIIFFNAELPGGFICAINHYIRTHNITSYEWYANSIISDTYSEDILSDRYGIYENNKENWVMDSNCNGDITNINNIDYIENKVFEKYPNGVTLYTSDIGIDVSKDYSSQEELNSLHNLGQIILGLRILAKNGNMFIKQYTFFTDFTISLIIILTLVFDNVSICKPLTSKPTNSEIYIVCRGYKGISFRLLTLLVNRLTKHYNNKTLPSNDFALINLQHPKLEDTLNSLIDINKNVFQDIQCNMLEYIMDAIDNIICECNYQLILKENNIFHKINTSKESKDYNKINYNIQSTMDNLLNNTMEYCDSKQECSKCNNLKWKKINLISNKDIQDYKDFLFKGYNNIYEHNKWLFFNKMYYLSDNNHIKTKYTLF